MLRSAAPPAGDHQEVLAPGSLLDARHPLWSIQGCHAGGLSPREAVTQEGCYSEGLSPRGLFQEGCHPAGLSPRAVIQGVCYPGLSPRRIVTQEACHPRGLSAIWVVTQQGLLPRTVNQEGCHRRLSPLAVTQEGCHPGEAAAHPQVPRGL